MFDKANNRNIKMTTKYENKANNKKKMENFLKRKYDNMTSRNPGE